MTRESVLQAIDEHDAVGQDAFLATYGYLPARDYLLVHEAKEYDSKAIAGVAHRFEYGRPCSRMSSTGVSGRQWRGSPEPGSR
ncbi:hypothetical protein [Kitasatospora sp. NPDC088346]|uniref:hypothetical protein n=1 Tax=Kitasatospora sp. NPDC088346 TaxID=3364073 RepID=UPI0038083801